MRGKVLAISSSDDLYALGETDGKERWHYSHRGDEKMTVRGTASPVVFGNEVFQGFSDGYFVALGAAQGRELWKRKLAVRSRFYDIDFTPYVDEQLVIVATYDGSLYSLDRLTGNTKWLFPIGSYSGPLVEGDVLYVPGLDRNFYALDRDHGQVKWKVEFEGNVGMEPVKVGDYILLPTSGDPQYLIDPKAQKIAWSGSLGTGSFGGASADPDGWFYTLSNYGNLYSFQIGTTNIAETPQTHHAPSALFHRLPEPFSHSS
jgi:outer membrane protein assembly factor BamB